MKERKEKLCSYCRKKSIFKGDRCDKCRDAFCYPAGSRAYYQTTKYGSQFGA